MNFRRKELHVLFHRYGSISMVLHGCLDSLEQGAAGKWLEKNVA
jgi:hypothetical protein